MVHLYYDVMIIDSLLGRSEEMKRKKRCLTESPRNIHLNGITRLRQTHQMIQRAIVTVRKKSIGKGNTKQAEGNIILATPTSTMTTPLS